MAGDPREVQGATPDGVGLSQVEPASAVSPLRASIPSATPIARRVIYFGSPAVVCCDAQCSKAWGIHNRPQISLGDDPDDTAFLADGELGEAPADPGTYEGGCAKPYTAAERLNKWCVRECERSSMSKTGRGDEVVEAPDFSRRRYNMPWLHPEPPAPCDEPPKGEDGLAAEGCSPAGAVAEAISEGQAPDNSVASELISHHAPVDIVPGSALELQAENERLKSRLDFEMRAVRVAQSALAESGRKRAVLITAAQAVVNYDGDEAKPVFYDLPLTLDAACATPTQETPDVTG